MDIEHFRRAGYQAIDRICDYYISLRDRPVSSQVEPGYLRKALPASAPTEGEDFQLIADDYQKYIIPGLTHWQHPSFFAYFPTACTFEGILGELYASSAPTPGFNWSASPACTELEAVVMDWTAQILGLDKSFYNTTEVGGGVIQTTASDSALIATVAARSRYIREHPDVLMEKLVLYTTTQTHSLGKKAGLVLGLKVRALEVTADDDFALRGEALEVALREDVDAGLHPFILIATVGTTSSGAVDRLGEIAGVAKHYPCLWLHVDAAWAGVALVCPEYREACQLPAVNNYADSFCTNFHKWGLINFDASCLWVRHRKHLTDALDVTPEFLRSKHGDAGTVIDYRNWHLGLGRRFRSLKFWFVLRSRGVKGFQKYITDCTKLNAKFAERIRESDEFCLVAKPFLALTVFRLAPKSLSHLTTTGLNDLNRAFYARLAARSDIAITQTDLNGVFCVRMAIGAEKTVERDIDRALDVIGQEGRAALGEWELKGDYR
ncbi:pyridoxal phosphate-dependent transferase [Suillus clintonianus]|uniref:pyridoxal phosphate-dependent transferase n=1 Tax=Suillus clintonianus TaxID=1904413 RepID=UPI001B879818|nr:pyridoxal phosphate-dependent transferase [Suillus clintonianus]KAG2153412.1 pyridoxal phosphate-dependent transferase [Suillus clintonianus]